MKNKRIVFMGTPIFAKEILLHLLESGYNIVALVSQPDRPSGRKKEIKPTPTKEVAIKYNIPVYQVEKIKEEYDFMKELNPDLIITCAYGQFIPEVVLKMPRLGAINLHASLLPKLRGGAPIQHAIIRGEKESGVSLMEMVKKMDAGRVYAALSVEILDSDNYDSLHDKLIEVGKKVIDDYLLDYMEGKLEGKEQNEEEATFGLNITKEEEVIDFKKTSMEVFNQIRGLSKVPGAHFVYNNEKVKVYESVILDNEKDNEPGLIKSIGKDYIEITTLKGSIGLKVIQLQGKNITDVKSYLNGNNKFKIGTFVG